MAILGSATYKLNTDNTGLTRGMAKAERSSRESARRIAGNFAKIGAGMLSVGGVIGFGLLKLVGQASTLEESINAVNVVFTTGSKAIHDYSRNSAKAVGLAKSDFLQLSAQTGGLFTNYGLSADEAANKTIILAERAADLASVYNTDVKRAFDAMSAGIRGETEAIRFFGGTDVTDASLEMFLLEKGIGKKVSELSQAEKGLFRFEAMLAQTDNTSGDFANTARSAANAMKILKAQIKDTAAGIGQGLLPVVEAVLPLVQNAVASFTAWAEANPKLVQVLVIAVATVAALAVGIGGLLLVVAGGIMVFTALGVATLITFGWIALIVLAVAALVAGGILLVKHWDKVKTSLVSVFKTVKAWLQPVVDLFNRWIANNPKLMRALVAARQAVDGLTMALGWLRQEVESAWDWLVAYAEEKWAELKGIWDEHVSPIWDGLKEELEEKLGPAFLWLEEKFNGLPGVVQLAFLGAAAHLAASLLAMLAVWVTRMLIHFAVFMATSLRRMVVWTARMLIQFAVFTATSLARMALWPAKMLVHLTLWVVSSLALYTWYYGSLLLQRATFLAGALAAWVVHYARQVGARLVFLAGALAAWVVHYARQVGARLVFLAGALAAWVVHYARLVGARLVFLAGALAAWVVHYARLVGARLVFLAGALAAWVVHYAGLVVKRLVFLAVALAAWVAHYAGLVGARVVFLAGALAAWGAHYALLVGKRVVFLAGALAAWVAHYALLVGKRVVFLAASLAAWVAHYALQTGAQVIFLAASLARMTVWAAAMAAKWLIALGPVGWGIGIGALALGGAAALGGPGGGEGGGGIPFLFKGVKIPGFAKGGIVTGPTLAMLGEAGPEAVVPLNGMGKGGRGLTVQVFMDGATILEADDAEQYIVDMVDRAVRRGVVLGSV